MANVIKEALRGRIHAAFFFIAGAEVAAKNGRQAGLSKGNSREKVEMGE